MLRRLHAPSQPGRPASAASARSSAAASCDGVMRDISRLSVWNDTLTAGAPQRRDRVRWRSMPRRRCARCWSGRPPGAGRAARASSTSAAPSRRRAAHRPGARRGRCGARPGAPPRSRASPASASPACSVSGRPASRAMRERAGVLARRMPELGAGEVEADHALALVAQRQPRRALGLGRAAGGASRRRSGRWAARCAAGPASSASTAASPRRPWASNSSGAMRNSASTQPSARASSAASKATRSQRRRAWPSPPP